MSEERNERQIFEGQRESQERRLRSPDRRRKSRRKSDLVKTLLRYAVVALIVALLVKFFG